MAKKATTKIPIEMDFRIADTFTDSLARLAGDEQKAVKTTAFDLPLNPAQATKRAPAALAVGSRHSLPLAISRSIS